MDVQDKDILCVGLCVLDVIHVCSSYPAEDVDMRQVTVETQLRLGYADTNAHYHYSWALSIFTFI